MGIESIVPSAILFQLWGLIGKKLVSNSFLPSDFSNSYIQNPVHGGLLSEVHGSLARPEAKQLSLIKISSKVILLPGYIIRTYNLVWEALVIIHKNSYISWRKNLCISYVPDGFLVYFFSAKKYIYIYSYNYIYSYLYSRYISICTKHSTWFLFKFT